ncbi:MAG TPA: protein-glutamate O-methyltransferase CheR [Caulobacterales bacterium]|nr:protein-glutamate O-methyltransferase CheR [Caulobacterales bacterium]
MLTDAEFAYVAREVKARCGAQLTREMSNVATQRLSPLARREGYASASEFLNAARIKQDDKLWAAIAETLAPSDTRFFRDKGAFEELKTHILPDLYAKRGGGVRVWSAGCATGQEAYSLAMLVEDLRSEGMPSAEIVATDMSERLLDKARSGLYTQFEVQRGLPIRKLVQHFEKVGDLWRISDRLRARVSFEQHNLLQDPGMLGRFDIVLCRHVLSGFEPSMRAATLERIAGAMASDGVLVLGAGEAAPETQAFAPSPIQGVYVRDAAWARAAA